MYEQFDSNRLTDGHFMLLETLEKDHQHDINEAIRFNSLALPIYKLACCHRDIYMILKAMKNDPEADRYPIICEGLVNARTKKDFADYVYSGATAPWVR